MRLNQALLASLLPAVCLVVSPNALADNWPHWRGPSLNGISAEQNPPVAWSKTKNVLWRLPLPGPAGATPVVWGDHIFLTSVDNESAGDLVLICADTSGKQLWKRKVGSGNKNVRRDEGNFASPSPSTDGKHVWAFMSNGLLACYDFEGKEIWKLTVGKEKSEQAKTHYCKLHGKNATHNLTDCYTLKRLLIPLLVKKRHIVFLTLCFGRKLTQTGYVNKGKA